MRKLSLALAIAIAAAATSVQAQTYPTRSVTVIVPFAAGGTVDIVARIVGAKLSDLTGVTVIVDNKGGAGGIMAGSLSLRT